MSPQEEKKLTLQEAANQIADITWKYEANFEPEMILEILQAFAASQSAEKDAQVEELEHAKSDAESWARAETRRCNEQVAELSSLRLEVERLKSELKGSAR